MVNLFGEMVKRQITKALSVLLLGLSLISCTDTDGPPADIIGTAASGAVTAGIISVVDATGIEIKQTINIDGSYRLDVRRMTAPFMLKTVASNELDPDLYSYAAEANVTANVTPLTNLAMFIASGSTSSTGLDILYDSWVSAFGTIDPLVLKDAQATVNANLSTQYTAFSLDPFTYDFMATRFLTNGTSFDALLDAMTVDLLAGTVAIAGVVAPITLDFNISITDFDIGGDIVAATGAYALVMNVSVDGGTASSDLTLSVNLLEPSVPTPTGNTQIVEDTFRTFYGSVGDIFINSINVTIGEELETIAEVDATITSLEDGDVNYIATYTYTLNL